MKVLTCSRQFPKGHPKAGQPTWFVEKVLNCFRREDFSLPTSFIPWTENYVTLLKGEEYLKAMAVRDLKHHTIRAGNRWKVGDMASLRVWSGKPYRSKQIEFAQVEVKKVWEFSISHGNYSINTIQQGSFIPDCGLEKLANNDGLYVDDFWSWFDIPPKMKQQVFAGQIICWSDKIEY
jgi:hypothetical protein